MARFFVARGGSFFRMDDFLLLTEAQKHVFLGEMIF
jgi:hypothetical protein